jgi:phenylacetate-coenzyme A ligase PaaK-like adenylate-forming protein
MIGITKKDAIVNLFPLTPVPHIGFLRTRDFATVLGIPVVSALTGTPYPAYAIHRRLDEAVRITEQSKGTVLNGIVSYVRRVIMRAEELGADFSCVRLVSVLGEPCPRGMREDMRRRLVRMGADVHELKIMNALGLTEMQGNTCECVEFGGGHNAVPDQIYMEVLDEHSREPIPDGAHGLFTITHLDRRGTVLLRYITGDLNAISNEVCPHCGRQGPRVVSNTVRTIELVKVKGTLINPDVIKEAIATVDGIDEYQIVFTKEQLDDPYSQDKLLIRVAAPVDERARIEAQLGVKVTEAAEMRASIEFVGMSEIFDPGKTLKSTRVVDLRPVEQ